jgi:hypothetical protein
MRQAWGVDQEPLYNISKFARSRATRSGILISRDI